MSEEIVKVIQERVYKEDNENLPEEYQHLRVGAGLPKELYEDLGLTLY